LSWHKEPCCFRTIAFDFPAAGSPAAAYAWSVCGRKRRGVTLTALTEQGLQLVLHRPLKRTQRPRVRLHKCRAGGGVLPGVDLDDSAGLLDRMESFR